MKSSGDRYRQLNDSNVAFVQTHVFERGSLESGAIGKGGFVLISTQYVDEVISKCCGCYNYISLPNWCIYLGASILAIDNDFNIWLNTSSSLFFQGRTD